MEIVKQCSWHKVIVSGYLEWHSWAEKQTAKGKKQTQCKCCNLWFFPDEMGG